MVDLVIDTNILLDYCCATRPEHASATRLLRACLGGGSAVGHVLASSLKDAYYLLCRHYQDEKTARSVIGTVRELFETHPLTLQMVDLALSSDEPDFEDGLVRAFAETIHADAIVSRDAGAFTASPVPRMSADECIEAFELE